MVEALFGLVHSRKYVCDWTDWEPNLQLMQDILRRQMDAGTFAFAVAVLTARMNVAAGKIVYGSLSP